MGYRVGNAPVSFGAWNLEASRSPSVPPPARVLAELAAAGYEGIELGPLGWLDPATAARHGLELTGGYIPIPFGDGHGPLDETLDLFDAVAPDARPIIADEGDPTAPLDHAEVARVVGHIRARGYEPTVHHHMGTRIETRAQIQQLLDSVDVHLLLDTGHLLAAGTDPREGLAVWRDRIDYVHLKDVDLARLHAAPDWEAAWRQNVFCELGTGDVDVRGFLADLEGFDGWVVVEQDWVPPDGADPEAQIAAQARNRAFLG